MSIGLATSQTGFPDFHPLMDSGGKRGASRASPVVVDPKADPQSQNFLPDLRVVDLCDQANFARKDAT
jgi:hypothetical protein